MVVCGALLAALAGCVAKTDTTSAETAFAARRSSPVREALAPTSPVVGEARLDQAVRVVARRRATIKIETATGLTGWVREEDFISTDVKRRVERIAERARNKLSQGLYRSHDVLNVHLEPARMASTIYQLAPDEDVELLERRLVEERHADRRGRRADWSLIRVPQGPTGWVLASRLYAAIPEEVAQYAEGRRITSYHALDRVWDARLGAFKTTWLWTQVDGSNRPHDFDRFRVFQWSPRRGEYQTVGLASGLIGRLPITIHAKLESPKGSGPGFTATIERPEGARMETYVLSGRRLRHVSAEPLPSPPAPEPESSPVEEPAAEGVIERLIGWWNGLS